MIERVPMRLFKPPQRFPDELNKKEDYNKFFDDLINSQDSAPSPEEKEFSDLIDRLNSGNGLKSGKSGFSKNSRAGKSKKPQRTHFQKAEQTESEYGEVKAGKMPEELLGAVEEIRDAAEKIRDTERFADLGAESGDGGSGPIDDIKHKIEDARRHLAKSDLESAREAYLKIIRIYKSLGPQEQAKIYNEIREFYLERKEAEGVA